MIDVPFGFDIEDSGDIKIQVNYKICTKFFGLLDEKKVQLDNMLSSI